MGVSEAYIAMVYEKIERAAAEGTRCPTNPELGTASGPALRMLIKREMIRTEVYKHNWRVIMLLSGPHKGKRTMLPKDGGKPYLRCDKGGNRYLSRILPRAPARIAP